ncbi:hypothetical protein [Salinibacter ruber]|uniref:Lipoprotein n=1 Tax=Salinibacter ruber TaxID=146919 RepID=A0A9X2U0X0_9BACT|nr:hypothetical protein [Salinibacter ruber]MBB4089416.1 hypothetical protein [Salinibacter ruber]MCS3611859.1 hypothetical protein [Salinibacter ruber]MCS3615449.1 hypothetical protein [Salinibacter ruber]MCS3639941.1 hypothetical protein [Salinibacter ruber]MCS3646405.1 hypothetical protein [Salinibacter ruber]
MKRTLAAGAFSLAIGAVSLLLLASVVYSCRSGGDPHHERSDASLDTPPVEDARSAPPDHRAST